MFIGQPPNSLRGNGTGQGQQASRVTPGPTRGPCTRAAQGGERSDRAVVRAPRIARRTLVKGQPVAGRASRASTASRVIRKFNCPRAHGLSVLATPTDRWWCKVCREYLPKGRRMFGCRQCNYDVCTSCCISPNGAVNVVRASRIDCPRNHGLTAFTTPKGTFKCDVCRVSIPKGMRANGCRRCDYNVCTSCCEAQMRLPR